MMYYGYMGLFGGLGMLVFWGLFIWLVIWLIRQNTPINQSSKDSPMDILKKRYAQGEITKKQFDEMKKELM